MKRARGGIFWKLLLALVLFAGLAGAGIVWNDFSRFRSAPLAVSEGASSLVIAPGTSFAGIIQQLRERGLSAAPRWYWRLLAERMAVTKDLHAGEYQLEPGMSPDDLLAMLARGEILQHHFTIIEGWRFSDLRQALAGEPGLAQKTAELDDARLMEMLGAAGKNPEGRFLPETYAYARGASDLDILRRSHQAMQDLLAREWPKRAEGLPLATPYEALILASIVEKETGLAAERPKIAGVFVRRLGIGMPLATDPTIIYGMGDAYHGNIRKSDLKADTPYNTYLRAGLPPTPIALPGTAAVHSALHPAAGKALYFVARGDGGHVFSANLRQHNRAVACYQLHRCN